MQPRLRWHKWLNDSNSNGGQWSVWWAPLMWDDNDIKKMNWTWLGTTDSCSVWNIWLKQYEFIDRSSRWIDESMYLISESMKFNKNKNRKKERMLINRKVSALNSKSYTVIYSVLSYTVYNNKTTVYSPQPPKESTRAPSDRWPMTSWHASYKLHELHSLAQIVLASFIEVPQGNWQPHPGCHMIDEATAQETRILHQSERRLDAAVVRILLTDLIKLQ